MGASGGQTGAAGGAGGAAGSAAGGGAGAVGSGGVAAVSGPGWVPLRQLSDTEYANSLQDVLGLSGRGPQILDALSATSPLSSFGPRWSAGDFDNLLSAAEPIVETRYRAYFETASAAVDAAFADAAARARILTCAPATPTDDTCALTIVRTFGQRAWRRPLTMAESDDLVALARGAQTAGGDFSEAMRQVLLALLASESFLYRVELDDAPGSTTAHPLKSYEIASRLSYLLWSTTPDDALLDLAGSNKLLVREGVAAEAELMLADPRAGGFVRDFFGQWLGFRALGGAYINFASPGWSRAVQASMAEEARAYVTSIVAADGKLSDLLTTDVNFVDVGTAGVYGFPAPSTTGALVRVVDTTDARKGFLGLGAFFAQTSDPTSPWTSATMRGEWVLERLLCAELPASPPNTGPQTGNAHEELDARSKMPACAACHSMIDPIGLGLEKFDQIGRFRTTYDPGAVPIDDHGTLPTAMPFVGLSGLADLLAQDDRVAACASRAALGYAAGRPFASDDASAVALAARWRIAGFGMSALVSAVVSDDAFRYRRGEGKP